MTNDRTYRIRSLARSGIGAIFEASRCCALAAGLVALLVFAPPSPAHELDDIANLPPTSRYAATRAFFQGGDVARTALEAELTRIPGAHEDAIQLGRDLDGDGDPDEIAIHLEVIEVQQEVYPGEFITFWVFAPLGSAMGSPARLPSPTIRVEEGDHVAITLHNTHYLPHTIHFHGTSQSNAMDGVPDMSQVAVPPGQQFTYRFVATRAGTYWYHCHVQDHVHVLMGLAGMFIVEPNRPDNHFAHLIPGAGRIESMAKASREEYQGEYSLVYMDIDDRLNRIPAAYRDPREIEKRMHREYDSTQRKANVFMLNGRSYPFTLRDTPILVKPDEATKLRILNVGGETLYLHTHGHHPTITDLDGRAVPEGMRVTRDTFDVGPAQRVDLALRTGGDPTHAAGPGVWLIHNHSPRAASNKGINPGGDHTVIIYDGFMGADGLPTSHVGHGGHTQHFDPEYYKGNRPIFPPETFNTTERNYEKGWPAAPPAGGTFDYPIRATHEAPLARLDLIDAERHSPVAEACADRPRGVRRITIKAGRRFAKEGEVFAFEPREIRAERCEEVEIVLENMDDIRHDLMIPGLNPIFALNLIGPASSSAKFVTPDVDVTLFLHCHIAAHDKVGMIGKLVVGKGGEPKRIAQTQMGSASNAVQGVGIVIASVPRMGRLIVNHEEIKGFMAAMEMSYPVAPPTLLDGLNAGDKIAFTINPAINSIVQVEVLERAR